MSLTILERLNRLNPAAAEYANAFLDVLLPAAVEARASDVHLQPVEQQVEIRWRIDGVLQVLGTFSRGATADIVVRLKVLADLLTYRTDIPQEGRIRRPGTVEMRVSTFPTLHGERAVVRLFANNNDFHLPEQLGLAMELLDSLRLAVESNSGAIIFSGPAGSGKTTAAYACLRSIVQQGSLKCVMTLEDPIESVLPGVSQSQISSSVGLTLATGVRSLLRQDPEVMFVGEIRDRETAEAVFQAALTGHLVLSTFHAGSAVEGIGRLREMGIENYLIRSGLRMLLNQRLMRRLCVCARAATRQEELLGLPVQLDRARIAVGCDDCSSSGYRGRLLVAESVSTLDQSLAAALDQPTGASGVQGLAKRALEVVEAGQTSPQEVRRVLGLIPFRSIREGDEE